MDINDDNHILDIIESDGLYKIVFKDTQKELPFSVKRVYNLTKDRWVLYTDDNRETILAKNGYFYGLYSCEDYEFIERISYYDKMYLAKKNGKYGVFILENFDVVEYYDKSAQQIINWVIKCVYDNIIILESNKYLLGSKTILVDDYYGHELDVANVYGAFLLKLTFNKKESIRTLFDSHPWYSKDYDAIITPPQPMQHLVVRNNGKYGAIERNTGKEVIEPKYESIDEFPDEFSITRRMHINNHYEGVLCIGEEERDGSGYKDSKGQIRVRFDSIKDITRNQYEEVDLFLIKRSRRASIINVYGFFYNIFNCREFDFIEHIKGTDLYICEIDEKYGIINEQQEVIFDVVYPNITGLLGNAWIRTYKEEFIYFSASKTKSKYYDKLEIHHGVFVTFKNGLYGLMKLNGEELVPPRYATWKKNYGWSDEDAPYLIAELEGKITPIYNNGKYYGRIPLDYDYCDYLWRTDQPVECGYYLVKKNNKYGIIKSFRYDKNDFRILLPIEYLSIKYFEINSNYKHINVTFIFLQKEEGYYLYNIAQEKEYALYDSLEFADLTCTKERPPYGYGAPIPYIIAGRSGKYSLLSQTGEQLTDFEFDQIEVLRYYGFLVRKGNHWGLINRYGEVRIDCSYDSIKEIKQYQPKAIVVENGEEKEIDLKPIQDKNTSDCEEFIDEYEDSSSESPTYDRYSGSYAQDVMGYSDDDIDTIFDGDPDAYWNID